MKLGAVIVETRPIPNLKEIIEGHTRFLPKHWGLKVMNKVRVNSIGDYNRLLTSKDFWQRLPYDKVLIFQTDSMLLREGIEEFLEYDYVGAPWKFQEHGGNGGLSLRSKTAMLKCIVKQPWKSSLGYEDVYFCNLLKGMTNLKLAPREVCEKFSCESIYAEGSLGYHAIQKYLTKEECDKIMTQYA